MQLNTLDNIFGTTKKDDKKTATQPVNVSSSKSRVSTLDNIFDTPKTENNIVETPKTPEIKPEKQEYLSQGKEDTRKEDTVLTRIGRAILPHFLEKELGISEEQRKTTLTRAETIKMQGMETTKYLANKNPEKVSPLEYLKRGISFGNELDPTDYLRGYKSDVSVEDLPEPVTAPQKISQAIGNILTMSLAQPLIESAFVGVVSKVPAGAKLLETVQTASKINPWTIGYGVDVVKAGATGGLFGLITENKQSVAKNVAETAGMFAAFTALTFPILQFFKPIISPVGKMEIKNPKISNILNDPSVTEATITKTLWFKNPKDPNQLLKVTANGMEYVSGKGKEIVEKGVYVKDIPTMTSVDIEAFQVKPSIYENLKSWIGGKMTKNVPFKVSDVTPAPSSISGSKVNTDITSSELRLQAEKLMTKAKSGDSSVLDELAGTQSAIRQFETSTKTTPIVVSGADDRVLATISTVEYSDGKFTIEINADAGSVGFNQGFTSSKIYNSEDEAIKAGNKMILDWANTQEKYVEGEDKNLLQTIKDSLDADTPYVINKPTPYDITAKGKSLVEFGKEAEKYKTPKEFEDAVSTMDSDKDFENVVQFHGTQKGDDLIKAIETGEVRASESGLMGKGFYLTSSKEAAQMFGKQVYDPSKQARTGVSTEPTIIPIDVTELNIKELDYGKSDYYEFLDDKNLTPDQYNEQLISEGYDGLNLKGRGETIIFNPSQIKVFDFNKFYSEATGKEIEPEKPKKAIIDKAKIEKLETELKDAYKKYPDAEKELETILVKMELAEAGKRVFTGYGVDREVTGVASTFPQWIPENLRTKKSLDALREVIKNVDSLTYPSKVNATAKRLLVNEMLNELDSKLGIDTMEIRNDILKEYGQIEKSDVGDVGGGKQGRGEPTGERAKIESAKKQDIQDEIDRLKLDVENKEDFDGVLSPEKITEKQNRIKELEAQLENKKESNLKGKEGQIEYGNWDNEVKIATNSKSSIEFENNYIKENLTEDTIKLAIPRRKIGEKNYVADINKATEIAKKTIVNEFKKKTDMTFEEFYNNLQADQEFMNDTPQKEIVVYRGESRSNGTGNYFTESKDFAREFTQSGLDSEITKRYIPSNEIYRSDILPSASSEKEITQTIKKAKDNGYKAIEVSEGKDQPNSIFVIDKTILKKETVKEEYTGEELLSKIKDSGVSITPSIKTEIKNQSFKLEKVSVDKVLKDDPDAKDFVDNFKGTSATKKTEPIIIGKWQGKDNSVMDGYHRLGAIKNSGGKEIEAYVSFKENKDVDTKELKAKEPTDIYTKEDLSYLNNNSYYNVDWNEDYKGTILSIKKGLKVDTIPEDLIPEWNTFVDKYTELYKKDLRIRAENPSPSVTGRSGYNFAKRDKSVARNQSIMLEKEALVERLDKVFNSYKFQTEKARKSELSEVDKLKENLEKENNRLSLANKRGDAHFIDFFTKRVKALERKISKLETGEKIEVKPKETQTEKYTREMKEESISKGSGFASMDKFRETMKPIEENIEKVNPVEFPELVKLARELMGEFPKVKLPRFRPSMGGRPYGVFYPVGDGKIILNPELFIQGNEEQAAKTLAHEIGHLLDYLPDKTMARGNILGRLAVLKKFGKEFYPEIGLTRSNKEMKRELWELSKYWKPVNEATASEGYLSYRKSPEEIYADFISVLLNDPKLAQDKAPEAYNVFFKTLDKKPEVKQAYFELQDLLAGTSEDLMKARQEDIRKGFERGEDLQAQFSAKKKLAKAHFWERLRQQLDDVNYPIIKKLREAEASGKIISEEDNPRFLLQEQSLVDNENYLLIDKVDKDIVKPLEKAGVIIEDIGEYLLLDRIINERVNIANPFGFNTKNAPKQLEFLQKTIGDKNFELLKEKVTLFHDLVFQSVEEAVKVGSYNKELFETKIKPNKEFYASFQVVDYMQDYIPATVKGQTGTLKEVANPFVSTILKTIALNRLNAFQRAKNATIKLLQGAGEGEIAKSKTITTDGKLTIFKVARDRGGLELLEDGKMTSYDVDPYIADSFKRDKIGDLNMIVSLLDKFNNKLFKPLVTTYNLGFAAAFNPIRDFKRNYKMIPNATILSLLKAYSNSLKSAVKYSKGELDEFTKSLVESKAIIAPVNEYNFDPRDDELGNTLKKYGLIKEYQPYDNKAIEFIRKTLLKPVVKTLEGIRFIANTFEIVSKIGGAKVRIAGGESGKQLSYNLRNYTGTPNWKVKGKQTNTTNAIFVFSNIMKEGIKSDFQVATDPKTRAGYWWKTTKIDLLPKFLMFLASAGVLGAGLKKFYDKVSEYDKANYIIIPLGVTDEKKAVYMRIPHDETGRMLSAIFWKMASFIKDKGNTKDLSDIFAVGAGQLPSVTPIITALGGWTQYLSGRNPYDSFRGRTVIDDTTWEAGGGASLKKMVQWTTNTLGVSSFATYDTHKNTGVETFMQTAPFFNRLFKISNYGETEQLREIKSEVKKEVAQRTLKEREIVEKYVQEATKDGKPSMFYMTKFANKAIKDALGGHMPRNDEEKKTADRIEKKFKVLIKKELNNDPRILSLIDAVSSDEKKAILKEIKKDMSSEEWSKIRTLLLKDKIVTEVIIYNIK